MLVSRWASSPLAGAQQCAPAATVDGQIITTGQKPSMDDPGLA